MIKLISCFVAIWGMYPRENTNRRTSVYETCIWRITRNSTLDALTVSNKFQRDFHNQYLIGYGVSLCCLNILLACILRADLSFNHHDLESLQTYIPTLVWFVDKTSGLVVGIPLIARKAGSWATYQIRKIAGCACTGNAGNVYPATESKENR